MANPGHSKWAALSRSIAVRDHTRFYFISGESESNVNSTAEFPNPGILSTFIRVPISAFRSSSLAWIRQRRLAPASRAGGESLSRMSV